MHLLLGFALYTLWVNISFFVLHFLSFPGQTVQHVPKRDQRYKLFIIGTSQHEIQIIIIIAHR